MSNNECALSAYALLRTMYLVAHVAHSRVEARAPRPRRHHLHLRRRRLRLLRVGGRRRGARRAGARRGACRGGALARVLVRVGDALAVECGE